MNRIVTICTALITIASVFLPQLSSAQAPEKMSYQAVVRNSTDQLVVNTQVGMKISIQKYVLGIPPSYQNVYIETHTPTTNENGLVSLKIGDGTVVGGVFTDIDWSNGEYFIKTETDPTGGTSYSITGTSQLLSVPYALYAKNVKTYKVGDFAQGGIVFWVDETGQHGLVCAKIDQSSGMRWNAGTNGFTRALGDGPFSGELNTSIIIAAHVAIGDDGDTYAARVCNELKVTEGGITYGDWYLPSKEELNIMYLNKSIIETTAVANGGSAFTSINYWSSCESPSVNQHAWSRNLGTGSGVYNTKGIATYYVRAIRAF
jgi:hypothetical protein